MVGLLGGAAVGVREAARSVLRYTEAFGSFHDVLSLGLYSVFWHAVPACVVMALVGVAMAILILTGRAKLRTPQLVGVYVGVFAFLCLPVMLMSGRSGSFFMMESYLASLFCGIGLGGAAYFLAKNVRDGIGLFAILAGGALALFIVIQRGLWALTVRRLPYGHPKNPLCEAPMLMLAVLAGLAGYYSAMYLVAYRSRQVKRRQLRRAFLLAVGAAAMAPLAKLLESVLPSSNNAGARVPKPLRPRKPLARRPSDRPDIVWIVMDTARADALSCYGNPRKTTPRLDEIANEATVYENAFSAAPWTLPSHASMFTGLMPSAHNATAEHQYLDGKFPTVAEVLSQHGYRSFSYSNNGWIGAGHNMVRGFDAYRMTSYGNERRMLLANRLKSRLHLRDYGARATNGAVTRWIARNASARQPFFVFINYMEVHGRYGSTPYLRRWLPPQVPLQRALAVPQDHSRYAGGMVPKARARFDVLRALYEGDATYLDFRIGQLVDFLRRSGRLDDTLLIVTSDHGEELGEHGLIDHAYELYNTMLRVPLIVRYPRAFGQGQRLGAAVQTIDIMPTILDVLKIDWKKGASRLPGRSLLAPVRTSPPRAIVAERDMPVPWIKYTLDRYPDWKGISLLRRLKSVQVGDFKYIWSSDGHDRLFDIRRDPNEQQEIIATMPGKAHELMAVLEKHVGPLHRAHA